MVLAGALFFNCTHFQIKILRETAVNKHQCFFESIDESRNTVSDMEKDLLRQGALRTKGVHIETQQGLDSKVIWVYRIGYEKADYFLVFKIMEITRLVEDNGTLSTKLDGEYLYLGEMRTVRKYDIGGLSDVILVATVNAASFFKIAHAKELSGLYCGADFSIPYSCREEWRKVAIASR